MDTRGGGAKSKAGIIQEFLERNLGKTFYSTEVVEALKGEGVRAADVMTNARHRGRRGLVCIDRARSQTIMIDMHSTETCMCCGNELMNG